MGGARVFQRAVAGTPPGCLLVTRATADQRHAPQSARSQIIKEFNKGYTPIIVCSDALARGLDLSALDVVINYDVPAYTRTYVHRVGRAARAGRWGAAYTLMAGDQVRHFMMMLRGVKRGRMVTLQVCAAGPRCCLCAR